MHSIIMFWLSQTTYIQRLWLDWLLWFLLWLQDVLSNRKLWKKIKVLLFTSPRNCIVYLGPHSEGTGEGGGERDTDLEFCFYWDWGLDNKFADSLFNGEFKQREQKLNCWKRKNKTRTQNGQLWKSAKISKTEEPDGGREMVGVWFGSFSSYVANVPFKEGTSFFENVSWQSKVKVRHWHYIKKNELSELTLQLN